MPKAFSLLALLTGFGLLAASALGTASQEQPPNTFRLGFNGNVELDPLFLYQDENWGLAYATGAMLFSYPDSPPPRGSRLIPEVAAGFPQVSRDGRTYTIRLKRTYRFNNGKQVTAKHFEFALLRAATAYSGVSELIADVVGAKAVSERKAAQISGVRVLDKQTLRIRIRERKPDLLNRLATPYFAAVPLNLPRRGRVQKPFLTAGPYFTGEWTPGRAILERNAFYRGPRPRRVNRIQVDVELPPETIKQNIDGGTMDAGVLPPSAHVELARRYGVRRRSPGRYFENPTATILYISFNHERPLFRGPGPAGNVRLKQAINHAIDRAALAALRPSIFGSAAAHDQLLPPSMPGFRDVPLYPRRPNLERARRLAAGQTRDGKGLIYCANGALGAQQCRLLQTMLLRIGLELSRSAGCPSGCIQLPEHDLAFGGIRATYFDPSGFFNLVDGATIDSVPAWRPRNDARFDHPTYTRRIRGARQLSGRRRYAAFGDLDEDIMRAAAPVAVYGVSTDRHYVSARVACYHHHPVYGWDFPAICLR
jgi:ABC-type oligopeptide transport system substrate-binding subunit